MNVPDREPGDDDENNYVANDGEEIDRDLFPLYAKVRAENDAGALNRRKKFPLDIPAPNAILPQA